MSIMRKLEGKGLSREEIAKLALIHCPSCGSNYKYLEEIEAGTYQCTRLSGTPVHNPKWEPGAKVSQFVVCPECPSRRPDGHGKGCAACDGSGAKMTPCGEIFTP